MSVTFRQFSQRKFLDQTVNICCGSALLLHDNGVLASLKPQTFETRFQSVIFLNSSPFSCCVNWQNGEPVKAVTKLMLMLMLVSAFCNSHDQTLIKHSTVHQKQAEYDNRPLRCIRVFVSWFEKSDYGWISSIFGCLKLSSNRELTTLVAPMVCHYKPPPPTTGLACILQRFSFM